MQKIILSGSVAKLFYKFTTRSTPFQKILATPTPLDQVIIDFTDMDNLYNFRPTE